VGRIDAETLRRGQYQEEGDFVNEAYEIEIRKQGEGGELLFSRSGNLWKDGRGHPIKVEKRFLLSINQPAVKAIYRITSQGEERRQTTFGIELNINLLAGDAPDRYYHIPGHQLEDRKLASLGECEDISGVDLVDEWTGMKVVLKMDRKGHLLRFPVETVSLSESGFERIFQGSCLLFYWPLELGPGEEFKVTIELGIYPSDKQTVKV